MKPDLEWRPEGIDLSRLEGAFSFEEGYFRPDWRIISKAIEQTVTGSLDLDTAWNEAGRQWVMRLQSDLGGDYRVEESRRFILLTALDSEAGGKILAFAERTLEQIR